MFERPHASDNAPRDLPSHREAVRRTYTRAVSDDLAVAVDCYAGSRGEETPRRFTLGDQLVEIPTARKRKPTRSTEVGLLDLTQWKI